MEFTPEHKKVIEKKVVDCILQALENKQITDPELPNIADYVLAQLDQIRNQDELLVFLETLCGRWPFFQPILDIEKGTIQEAKEEQAAQDVVQLAKNGNIEEAIRLAKSLTEPS